MNTTGLSEYRRKLKLGIVKATKPLDPIEKAKTKPNSLRFAINAKCYDCCCYQKAEISLCTAEDCPLFNLRPYQL